MDMGGLVALAQGIGTLVIAGLSWTLITLACQAKQQRPRTRVTALPPRPKRKPQRSEGLS